MRVYTLPFSRAKVFSVLPSMNKVPWQKLDGISFSFMFCYGYSKKKIASDGNRRPVLTSETTKRKKVADTYEIIFIESYC